MNHLVQLFVLMLVQNYIIFQFYLKILKIKITIKQDFLISDFENAPSGNDKTSILVEFPDRQGVLVEFLTDFNEAGINLTKLNHILLKVIQFSLLILMVIKMMKMLKSFKNTKIALKF